MTMKRFWKTAWQKNGVLPRENFYRQSEKLQYQLKHRHFWLPFIAATLRFCCPHCDRHIRTDDRTARLSVSYIYIYRVIHKSLRDFRPLRYSSRDGHTEGGHVNRGRDTPSFCPNLQVLDMSTLGEAAVVNNVIKFLPHTCNAVCVAGTWLQDWHLPRPQGWIYRAPVR